MFDKLSYPGAPPGAVDLYLKKDIFLQHSWYFISSGDQIITPTSERAMATRAHATITEFDGGSHLTLVSHPDAVTAVILDAVHAVS